MKRLINRLGYLAEYHPEDERLYVRQHILIAERILKKRLPRGVVVHHIDGDKTNNKNSNLIICTQGYHKVLHLRENSLKNTGNVTSRKCAFCKEYSLPHEMVARMTSYNVPQYFHRECRNEYARKYYRRKH